jgi:tripartite-type tricarboxylate transporter receptor subunit TctC
VGRQRTAVNAGPPGLPADIAAKLNQIFSSALRDSDAQERLARIGLQVVASSPDGLTQVLQRDVPKWGAAVKASGAVAD